MLKLLTLRNSASDRSTQSNLHSSLCIQCNSIFSGTRRDKPLGVTATAHFWQSLQQLQASAESGECHLCYIRWRDLSPKEKEDLQGCTKVTFGFWTSLIGDGVAFEYFYPQPFKNGKECLTKSVMLRTVDGAYIPTAPKPLQTFRLTYYRDISFRN